MMSTNLYSENSKFHLQNFHVIPAMMLYFHEALQQGTKEVVVWGIGKPMCEFLRVDDMVAACVHVMGLSRNEFLAVVLDPMRFFILMWYGYRRHNCSVSQVYG